MLLSGDLHGNALGELNCLSLEHLCAKWGEAVLQEKYLVILGDAGFLWDESGSKGGALLQAFDAMPWTTLCVAGNHEQFPKIYNESNHTVLMGQEFYQISDKVFYFKRYGSYQLEGRSFLVLGGARSIDREYRVQGESWFPEEVLSVAEQEDILQHYTGHYAAVLAHTLPARAIPKLVRYPQFEKHDPNAYFLMSCCPSSTLRSGSAGTGMSTKK